MFEIPDLIIKTRKLSTREVKNKFREFIDSISEDCGPEIEHMADELKGYGDQFVDALSGQYRGTDGVGMSSLNRGNGVGYRANDGNGFRNGGGYSHSFRNGGNGEFRDDVPGMPGQNGGVQMRDGVDWNEKEKQRQYENAQKLEQLEAEMKRLKMRIYGG